MRNTVLSGVAIALALTGAGRPAQAATAMRWRTSWAAALAEAKRTHKLIMVDFYTDWCGWCKRLDKDTYTDAGVLRTANQQYLPLKLNAEKAGAPQARRYRVNGFPAILFINEKGSVVDKIDGYLPPAGFTTAMAKAAQRRQALAVLETKVQTHPKDDRAATTLALAYLMEMNRPLALPLVTRIGKLDPNHTRRHYSVLCSAVGDDFQQEQRYPQAISWFRKAASVARTPDDRAYAHASIAECYVYQNKLREALPEVKATLAIPQCRPKIRSGAEKMQKYLAQHNVR